MARAVESRDSPSSVRTNPDRLRWLATRPDAGSRASGGGPRGRRRAAGCVGVEIGTAVERRRLDEPEFEPFWAAAERLGLPVTLHPAYGERNPGPRLLLPRERARLSVRDDDRDRAPDRLRGARPPRRASESCSCTAAATSRTRSAACATPAPCGRELARGAERSVGVPGPPLLRHHHPRSGRARLPHRPGGRGPRGDGHRPARSTWRRRSRCGLLEAAASGEAVARAIAERNPAALYGFPELEAPTARLTGPPCGRARVRGQRAQNQDPARTACIVGASPSANQIQRRPEDRLQQQDQADLRGGDVARATPDQLQRHGKHDEPEEPRRSRGRSRDRQRVREGERRRPR